jgi:SAM-dependent methyltransferase
MFQINWKFKAFLYLVFSFLRLKGVFYFLQKYITKRSLINIKRINSLWDFHANSIIKNNSKYLLELGAGKSLEQNIFFSYKFNNTINQTAIDINNMLDLTLVNQASEQISNILKLKNKGKVENINQLKKLYNISYIAPCSLSNLKNINSKFDICVSTNSLEHFELSELKNYLEELKTILKPGGLSSLIIDYIDHYSHKYKNISPLNYLRYSDKEWEKYNNQYLFQNRLRHQDYKNIFKEKNYLIKDIFLGKLLSPPSIINKKFELNNDETFVGWAYFLIMKKKKLRILNL